MTTSFTNGGARLSSPDSSAPASGSDSFPGASNIGRLKVQHG